MVQKCKKILFLLIIASIFPTKRFTRSKIYFAFTSSHRFRFKFVRGSIFRANVVMCRVWT